MALIKMPLDQNLPWYDFNISLSGARYNLEVRYNTRSDRWHLSVGDAAGNPILQGLPMLVNRALLAQYRTFALPPGELVVVDTGGQDRQPGLSSFLTTHALLYIEPGT